MESTSEKVLSFLQAHGLKKEGSNKYRCNNPTKTGSDSMSWTIEIHDAEHGTYFDHIQEQGGSLYELARLLNIDVGAKVQQTKRKYHGMADYADAHGVPVKELFRWGWRETQIKNRQAMEIPTNSGKRWRFLDGKKPVFISEPSYKRCWYGLNAAVLQRLVAGYPLVVVNGEPSVITAQYYGWAATCVTGGEKSAIPPELIAELQDFLGDLKPRVIVALDCDHKSQSARLLSKQFRELGYDSKAVDLMLSRGGDAGDFCSLYQDKALDKLMTLPELPTIAPQSEVSKFGWSLLHASELKNLPKVSWIIPKQIQAYGLNVIYGMSGLGKSFLALNYALQVSQTNPVIYMAGEGVYGYENRIKAWEIHNKKNRANLYICTGAVSLLDEDDFQTFLQQSEPIKPVMVIVDTLSRSMAGADENSTRDMGLFIRACDQIKNHLGCAVVLVHHVSNKSATNTERGSSALRGAADVMIRVSGVGDDIAVEFSKVKDESPLPEAFYRLVKVNWMEGDSENASLVFVESERVIQTQEDPLTNNQQKILRVLSEVFQMGATVADVAMETGIPRPSVHRTMNDLRELTFVSQTQTALPYSITEQGKAALKRQGVTLSRESHESHDDSKHDSSDQEKSDVTHVTTLQNVIWAETPAYYKS